MVDHRRLLRADHAHILHLVGDVVPFKGTIALLVLPVSALLFELLKVRSGSLLRALDATIDTLTIVDF